MVLQSIAYLYSIFQKQRNICIDTRILQKDDIYFGIMGSNFNGNAFATEALEKGASYVVIDDPKYYKKESNYILVDHSLQILQKLAKYHRQQLTIPIIAITGSNGKTTTKELIKSVLAVKYCVFATHGNLNNHIGVPLSLLNINESHELGIIEMGANHIGEIEALCQIALPSHGLITNIGKAHLEGFGSLEGVFKAKSELYQYLMKSGGTIFIDPKNYDLAKSINMYKKKFKIDSLQKYTITYNSTLLSFQYNNKNYQSQMTGNYNINNINQAIGIATYFGVNTAKALKTICNYRPRNNRSQIEKIGTNSIIYDFYNANPTSMRASIQSALTIATNNLVLILGDMNELGVESSTEHTNIISFIEKNNLTEVYLVGPIFHSLNIDQPSIISFPTIEDLYHYLSNHNFNHKVILIKGSRSIYLEKLLSLFADR